VIVMGGTGPMDTANRRPWIDWVHTALVQGNLVRDFVKWDDQPASVEAVPDSFIRAYRLATTDPMGPRYICYDGDVQEKQLNSEVTFPSLDRYPAPLPLQAPEEGFEKTIRWLLEAKRQSCWPRLCSISSVGSIFRCKTRLTSADKMTRSSRRRI